MERARKRLLILSVGYGQGHHAAASALEQEFARRRWSCCVVDPCAESSRVLFPATQSFYRFCVRRAPWLWGIVYSQTDTADWGHAVHQWPLTEILRYIARLLAAYQPDFVICTYPLYAYMLDVLQQRRLFHGRYAVVVTDALEISRPWMLSRAPLICLPDEYSAELVQVRYGLDVQHAVATGFPVRREFVMSESAVPTADGLRLLYGAYCSTHGVIADIETVLRVFPRAELTVLAGARASVLQRHFAAAAGRVRIFPSTRCMAELMAASHFYIGKAGAATLFECYGEGVPVLVNFALPGQEQGNLELLLRDGAGCAVGSAAELVGALQMLLADGARGWLQMREAMRRSPRARGAARIADEVERRFFA